MIRIYRRHVKSCKFGSETERRCKCPIHVEGKLGEETVERRSLHLTSWEAATRKVREWEAAGTTKGAPRIKLAEATKRYLDYLAARRLSSGSLRKITKLLEALNDVFDGGTLLDQIGPADLREFQQSWRTWGPLTQSKNIERLRSFWKWCIENKWVAESPARCLAAPRKNPPKVKVFTDEELRKIHAEIGRPIMRAFILVLQYTALRIGDATKLRASDIEGGKLRIVTQKAKTEVWLPLPPFVLSALESLRATEHYFWSGESKLSTAVGSRRRGVAKLLKRAGVKGNPHMFRHTLATTLLANGTSPADVARILGNSEKIVREYYDHWIPARQVRIETELQKTWQAPLVLVK